MEIMSSEFRAGRDLLPQDSIKYSLRPEELSWERRAATRLYVLAPADPSLGFKI